ncbi:MAG TPA: transcriptional regulator [Eggerthellaceae bacterium]|nr:transcriptional regulator [Eggerthellaceae bacterium]
MLKIGEFSKLSQLTVKALRFYEREGILAPSKVDPHTGYRLYTTSQPMEAAKVKSLRQLGVSVEEVRRIIAGADARETLQRKAEELRAEQAGIAVRISIIDYLFKEGEMDYQVTEKAIPATIVYYSEATLEKYSDAMQWIPAQGAEVRALNPGLKCAELPYEFVEYLDGEYRERNVRVRHSEAVTARGVESDNIKFRDIPETKVLSLYHKGAYEEIGAAYAYIYQYAEDDGYEVVGLSRESYIDGVWNKDSVDEWLTEIQLLVK